MPHFSYRFAQSSRLAAVLLAAAGLFAVLTLSASSPAPAASSLYSVVRTDTQESVTGTLARVDNSAPAALVVSQKEKSFLPAAAELRAGQAVEIVNDDATVHNVFCASGDFKYNSGPQQPGTKSRITFTAPGTYEVRCAIHPKMRLTVTVQP